MPRGVKKKVTKKAVSKKPKPKAKKKTAVKGKVKVKVKAKKVKTQAAPVAPKKRGRPPKEKKPYKAYNEPEDYVPPKTYKFLGYCPKAGCGTMIMPTDLDTKTIFVCPVCHKRARVTQLKEERHTGKPAAKTKSEFLNSQNLNY